MAIKKEHLRLLSRRFWGSVFSLVIAIAVVVQLGREAFPLLNDYRDKIANVASENWSVDVSIGSVSAFWSGLRPRIELSDVAVMDNQDRHVFTFSHSVAEFGIIESIRQWRLLWRELIFRDFETTLIQREDGSWRIYGAAETSNKKEKKQQGRYSVEKPLDVLLIGRRVHLENARINLHFHNGLKTQIQIPEISIENDDDFLRILANAQLEDESQSFKLVVEGHGNPRNAEKFVPSGYLSLENFPFQKFYGIFAKQLGLPETVNTVPGRGIDMALWFKGFPHQGMTMRGSTSFSGIAIENEKLSFDVDTISANLIGRWHLDDGWTLGVRNFAANVNEVELLELNIDLKGKPKEFMGMRVDRLDAEQANAMLLSLGVLGDIDNRKHAAYILNGLKPKGELRNISVSPTDKERGYFHFSANAHNVSVQPIFGSPGLDAVDGYVELNAFGGFVDVDVSERLALTFPYIYNAPLELDKARGRIGWELDLKKRLAYITSDILEVETRGAKANGALFLKLPFNEKRTEPEMTLYIGMKNAEAKDLKRFIPKTISPQLYDWLDDGINEGRLTEAQFIYHGSIAKSAKISPSIQLSCNVYDGNIVFDKQWPELKNITASFLLDNNHLNVDVKKAELLGNSVNNAQISLLNLPQSNEPALSIRGGLSSKTSSALELLQASPIGEVIGNVFEDWSFTGKVATNVELIIPLSEDATEAHHKVEASFMEAGLHIPEADFTVSNIKGVLDYHTQTGFSSRELVGEIWEKSIDFNVKSVDESEQVQHTEIAFKGEFDMKDLVDWTQFPELMFMSGQSDLTGRVHISGEAEPQWPVEIHFESDLVGVSAQLPEPFIKVPDEARPLVGVACLGETQNAYKLSMEGLADFYLLDELEGKDYGALSLNRPLQKEEIENTQPGRFIVNGVLHSFNLDHWLYTGEVYEKNVNTLQVPASEEPLLIDVNAQIGDLDIEFLNIPSAKVTALIDGDRWDINVESDLVAGNILLPAEGVPVFDLDYIHLDKAASDQLFGTDDEENTEEDIGDEFTVNDLEPFDFSVKQVMVEDMEFGQWRFKLRLNDSDAVITDLYAKTINLEIGSEKKGAEAYWIEHEDKSSTRIVAEVKAGDLGKVLEAIGEERSITSKSAKFHVNMEWDGAPYYVALDKLRGRASFDVKNGSFIRGAESDETELLRLLALFNFDTIARRLKLDFSDLAAEGFSYDSVEGELEFGQGQLLFMSPIEVKSSSSSMKMAGSIDLVEETLDTDLVVTLPVTGNVAALVGLLGGLPAAIGVYVVGKMFKKQVDKLSSISYSVSGEWDDPKIKVKKIFDDEAAQRKADKLVEQEQEGGPQGEVSP